MEDMQKIPGQTTMNIDVAGRQQGQGFSAAHQQAASPSHLSLKGYENTPDKYPRHQGGNGLCKETNLATT